eukprot:6133820-Lingulodinium_polyedra.AAC.1
MAVPHGARVAQRDHCDGVLAGSRRPLEAVRRVRPRTHPQFIGGGPRATARRLASMAGPS